MSEGVELRPHAFPLVLAAPSGAGKTSLAQALVHRNLSLWLHALKMFQHRQQIGTPAMGSPAHIIIAAHGGNIHIIAG